MRRIFFILLLTFVFFLLEFILYNSFGRWFKPNLLVILVVYFNLAFGIRYSLIAALFAGIWKDSFGINIFGLNIFAFIFCAYLTILLKRYLFHMGSSGSRVLIVFLVSVFNILILYILISIFSEVNFGETVVYVLLPEVILTTLLTGYIFKILRKCVLRLSV